MENSSVQKLPSRTTQEWYKFLETEASAMYLEHCADSAQRRGVNSSVALRLRVHTLKEISDMCSNVVVLNTDALQPSWSPKMWGGYIEELQECRKNTTPTQVELFKEHMEALMQYCDGMTADAMIELFEASSTIESDAIYWTGVLARRSIQKLPGITKLLNQKYRPIDPKHNLN